MRNILKFSPKGLTSQIANLYSSKPLFLIKHSLWEKKLKPAKNNQIWLVAALYRFCIRRPPFQDNHF